MFYFMKSGKYEAFSKFGEDILEVFFIIIMIKSNPLIRHQRHAYKEEYEFNYSI